MFVYNSRINYNVVCNIIQEYEQEYEQNNRVQVNFQEYHEKLYDKNLLV